MKTDRISRKGLIGYSAGILTGITYGLNPLFGMPLMKNGAAIESILFFRYGFAVVLLGLFLLMRKESFRISVRQAGVLLVLGVLYTFSSIFLFGAYNYIASGLATTLIFLYPVLVAIIMVFLKVVPSWPVWLSIFATFTGVIIMTRSGAGEVIDPIGGTSLAGIGNRLCVLRRHNKPEQNHQFHIEFPADFLHSPDRSGDFPRKDCFLR